MYFATLTEVPIVQGLLGAGMGQGPALALLLAGPSLSLPSILVIGGELGLEEDRGLRGVGGGPLHPGRARLRGLGAVDRGRLAA